MKKKTIFQLIFRYSGPFLT